MLSLVMKATTTGGAGAEVTGGDVGDGGEGEVFGAGVVVGVVTVAPGVVTVGEGGGIGSPPGPGAEATPGMLFPPPGITLFGFGGAPLTRPCPGSPGFGKGPGAGAICAPTEVSSKAKFATTTKRDLDSICPRCSKQAVMWLSESQR